MCGASCQGETFEECEKNIKCLKKLNDNGVCTLGRPHLLENGKPAYILTRPENVIAKTEDVPREESDNNKKSNKTKPGKQSQTE